MTWHERKRVSYGVANLETTKWEQAKAAKRVQLTNMGQSLSYAEKEKERPERKKKGGESRPNHCCPVRRRVLDKQPLLASTCHGAPIAS